MAKFCMKCGSKLEENEKFCKACGTPVDGTERKMVSNQYIGTARSRTELARQPKANSDSGKGVIIALGLVIVALCGTGGYYYYQSHQSEKIESTVETTAEKKSSETDLADKSREEQTKTSAPAQDSPMDKAKAEMAEYGIKGEFTATTYGHSKDGFIAVDNVGQVIVVDRKNHRVGTVKPRMSLSEFQQQRNAKHPSPMLMDCTFANDSRDSDANAGYWKGTTHYMTIYALYKFDDNGNLVPGMLTSAQGEKPSHYQDVLYEVRNVDFANLFLTEAISIKL